MSDAPGAGPLSTEELFRQHAPFVTRFLARLGVPAAQLEDALQEVFLVVHRHGGYRPGPAKPTSYLAGLAIHAATKHRRQEQRQRLDVEAEPEALASEVRDPRQTLEAQEGLRKLQAALDRLPEELRVTLILVEIEGESCLSVAAAMNLPVGTVYWRAHEARKRLQAALKQLDAADSRPRARTAQPATAPRRAAQGTAMGIFSWNTSESAREMDALFALARADQPSPHALEHSFAAHQQLVQSGASLPSWTASVAPQSASWVTLLGGAGAVSSAAVGAVAVVVALALPASPQRAEPAPRAAVTDVSAHGTTSPQAATEPPAEQALDAPAIDAPTLDAPTIDAPTLDESIEPQPPTRAPRSRPARRASSAQAAQPVPSAEAAAAEAVQPARPARAAIATPAAPADPARELLELQEVARAERLLATQPAQTLALVRGMQQRFPSGYLAQERAYLEVMALLGLGRHDEAVPKAERFLRAHPEGPYSRRVRAVLRDADTLEP